MEQGADLAPKTIPEGRRGLDSAPPPVQRAAPAPPVARSHRDWLTWCEAMLAALPRDTARPSSTRRRTRVLRQVNTWTRAPRTHRRGTGRTRGEPRGRTSGTPSGRGPPAELAMRRLRDEIGLEPVEYPTTRQVGASPEARAADLPAAFGDPEIRAVLATIGGDDQITVLPCLNPDVFASSPKAFLGYSDNTNLLNWLWNLGVGSYHGGSTMVHLGRPGAPSRRWRRTRRTDTGRHPAAGPGTTPVRHPAPSRSGSPRSWRYGSRPSPAPGRPPCEC